VSPKLDGSALRVRSGDELKVIYRGQDAAALEALGKLEFRHRFVQPEWGTRYEHHLAGALRFLERQARYRLSLQIHKVIGLP
jgi:hypothetical protein